MQFLACPLKRQDHGPGSTSRQHLYIPMEIMLWRSQLRICSDQMAFEPPIPLLCAYKTLTADFGAEKFRVSFRQAL